MARARGLGRGLDALIPRNETSGVEELPIQHITPNRHQPRDHFDAEQLDELAESIRTHGILQPILVRETTGGMTGGYELIAGERRLRAAKLAGLTTIPAVVRSADGANQLELALIENLQRADLGPIEEADAYRELIERFGVSQEAVARRVGKSRVAVTNALRLLDLEPETRSALGEGRITEGHGRALAALTAPDAQRSALQHVLARQLSVRQTEELVRRLRPDVSARRNEQRPSDLADLEGRLRTLLATRVAIARSRRGGRVVIDFYSDEELDRIHAIIAAGAEMGDSGPAVASVSSTRERTAVAIR